MKNSPRTRWLTGLSAAGETTLAHALAGRRAERGVPTSLVIRDARMLRAAHTKLLTIL